MKFRNYFHDKNNFEFVKFCIEFFFFFACANEFKGAEDYKKQT